MRKQAMCAALMLVLAYPTTILAESAAEGRFGTRTTSTVDTELPDGRTLRIGHYTQITFADSPDHPLNNQIADCVGQYILSPDGAVLYANGSCFSQDVDGDGVSFWWRMDQAATTGCPNMCGSFGYFAGFGKFEGMTGGGTWIITAPFSDGNLGTWEGKYTME